MGEACSPENMAKNIIPALEDTAVGRYDPEAQKAMAKRWENSPIDYLQHYKAVDRVRNNGRPLRASELLQKARNQGIDVTTKNEGLKDIWKFSTGRMALAAQERFGKTFMADISKAVRGLSAKYDTDTNEFKSAYNRIVVPMVRKKMGAIVRAGKIIKDDNLYKSHIKNVYGLEPDEVIDAVHYLEWLEAGGAHQVGLPDSSGKKSIGQIGSRISKAMARYNVPWALFNVADLGRLASGIIADARIKTPMDAFRVSKGIMKGVFGKLPEELKKIEGSDPSRDIETAGKLDPFAQTVALQRRVAWEADKALGGDGYGYMSSHVFDYHPYEAPEMLWETGEGSRMLFRLGRFMMAESSRTQRLLRTAIGGGEQGRARALAEILTDWAIKSALFGVPAIIPTELNTAGKLIYGDDEWKEYKENLAKLNPISDDGVVTDSIQGAVNAFFGEGKVKVSMDDSVRTGALMRFDYLGNFPRAEQGSIDRLWNAPVKAIYSVKTGDGLGVIMNLATMASAIGNVKGISPTQITKLLEAIAESHDAKNPKKFATEMTKAVIGYNSAKQDDGSRRRRGGTGYVARRKPGM